MGGRPALRRGTHPYSPPFLEATDHSKVNGCVTLFRWYGQAQRPAAAPGLLLRMGRTAQGVEALLRSGETAEAATADPPPP